MLTWDTTNNVGIPFEWANLNGAQQAALTFGDDQGQRVAGLQGFAHAVTPAKAAVNGQGFFAEPASKPKSGDSP